MVCSASFGSVDIVEMFACSSVRDTSAAGPSKGEARSGRSDVRLLVPEPYEWAWPSSPVGDIRLLLRGAPGAPKSSVIADHILFPTDHG